MVDFENTLIQGHHRFNVAQGLGIPVYAEYPDGSVKLIDVLEIKK
jgi:hypothetical protein